MHTIWKGNISFGLINIGVRLHSAIEDKDIKFKNLHKDTLTPVKNQKVSSDSVLTDDDIVKGFEYANDKYVVINSSEIKELKEKYEIESLEIVDFIMLPEIDPIYYNNSYYLSPMEGQNKAYALLRKALSESNKVGLAKISIRSNQQLAVIRTYMNSIVLETLHFPEDVRPVEMVPNLSEEIVDERELKVAMLLIDQLTTPFEPLKYTNEYRSALKKLIDQKINEMKDDVEAVTSLQKNSVLSLMDALEASIERTKPSAMHTEPSPNKSKKKKEGTKKKASM